MNTAKLIKLKYQRMKLETKYKNKSKGMPGQEKMVFEYYQKNPALLQSI